MSVWFSPFERFLILASACADASIRLWDVKTRQPLGDPIKGHSDVVTSVAFSPDGQTLASAGLDNTVRVWDTRTRQPLNDPLRGHTGAVRSVAFSPDDRILILASASADASIRLWDVKTRQPLGDPLTNHSYAVNSVAFSPDGQTLASGAAGGSLWLWYVDVRSWMLRACDHAGRNLSKQEWDEFIGAERPYHRTCPQFPPGDGAPANAP
jgi:WD40 repeat protein